MFNTKRWSYEWRLYANYISDSISNIWFCDPGTAIKSFPQSSKVNYLGKVFAKYEFVDFCDGSWKRNNDGYSNRGIGGVVLNKKMEVVYLFSSPCVVQDSRKA